jgi:hypothetical protein
MKPNTNKQKCELFVNRARQAARTVLKEYDDCGLRHCNRHFETWYFVHRTQLQIFQNLYTSYRTRRRSCTPFQKKPSRIASSDGRTAGLSVWSHKGPTLKGIRYCNHPDAELCFSGPRTDTFWTEYYLFRTKVVELTGHKFRMKDHILNKTGVNKFCKYWDGLKSIHSERHVFHQNARVKISNSLSESYTKTLMDMTQMQRPVLI